MNLYNVYVGKFDSCSECNKELKKLNNLGLKGYIFSMDKQFSLRVSTSPDYKAMSNLVSNLKAKGFDAFIQ